MKNQSCILQDWLIKGFISSISAGDSEGKKMKEKGKRIIESIIKTTDGIVPSLMARGNFGRAILKVSVMERVIQAMPTDVSTIMVQEMLISQRRKI